MKADLVLAKFFGHYVNRNLFIFHFVESPFYNFVPIFFVKILGCDCRFNVDFFAALFFERALGDRKQARANAFAEVIFVNIQTP